MNMDITHLPKEKVKDIKDFTKTLSLHFTTSQQSLAIHKDLQGAMHQNGRKHCLGFSGVFNKSLNTHFRAKRMLVRTFLSKEKRKC